MDQLTITRPDDWHIHLRDGTYIQQTVLDASRTFGRVLAMPNLDPPITNWRLAKEYREKIMPFASFNFQPLFALYLTENTTPKDIERTKKNSDFIPAYKLYPAGATTNSDAAVKTLEPIFPIFEEMQKQGMLLLIHGEVTDDHVDIFDREKEFIDRHLTRIVTTFPELKIVFEHITTKDAVDFVVSSNDNVAATITPQHLLLNRNDMLVGGIRPHNYCLPVLKRNIHQQALRKVVATGNKKFFLGTDSAPHEKDMKESACGCAGCYSAWSAIELYTHVFDELDALDKLEGFASHYGADFYGLPRNEGTITLVKEDWTIPEQIILPNGNPIVPFFAGQNCTWKLID